jgi:hypothetical protein
MSWQDWTQLIAALVSAIAAGLAAFFAWRAVSQASDLRREDRRVRLGDFVGDFAATLLRVVNGAHEEAETTLPIARARLAAALASAEEPLPASDGLLALDKTSNPEMVQLQAALAADELAGVDPTGPPDAHAEAPDHEADE